MKKLLICFCLGLCITILAQRFVRTANTIAELVASNPNNVHTNVMVLGLTNVNDNQGGVFSWTVGNTNTTNAWDVFASQTSTNGRWLRKSYSSGTNYGNNATITNINTTTLVSSNIYVTNLYVTNLYTTNIIGGQFGQYVQTIGSGTNFVFQGTFGTEAWQQIVFSSGTPSIVLTNAGTYFIVCNVSAEANSTTTQTFMLTNVTTAVLVPGTSQTLAVSSVTGNTPLSVIYTTTNANNNIQLWGYPDNLTYTHEVVSTNTVLSAIRLQ